jgi:outer membrane immunogenic protein
MKKILLGMTALIAVNMGGAAMAADIPVKAPRPVVYDNWDNGWGGFYVGAALGAKWGHTTWTTTAITNPPFFPVVDASSPRNYDPKSFRFGGYLGYNWQFASQWVAGLEVDFGWADKTVTTAGIPGCSIACVVGFPGPLSDLSSVRMRWDASARGRLGYIVTPNVLFYGTGGIAWQNIETSATCQHSAPDPLCLFLPGNPFVTATNSVTRVGWTLGAGLEAKLSGNWIARGEYRYANFGTWNDVLNLSLPGAATTVVYGLKVETHIATFGLAYKFGGPVVARY